MIDFKFTKGWWNTTTVYINSYVITSVWYRLRIPRIDCTRSFRYQRTSFDNLCSSVYLWWFVTDSPQFSVISCIALIWRGRMFIKIDKGSESSAWKKYAVAWGIRDWYFPPKYNGIVQSLSCFQCGGVLDSSSGWYSLCDVGPDYRSNSTGV